MFKLLKRLSAPRLIALGFLGVILVGSLLLWLPFSLRQGVSLPYIDALFTATSAVCVTGLSTVDAGSTFSVAGQVILGLLMQIGGLGVTAIGAGMILAVGRKMDLKSRNLMREAMNLDGGRGIKNFVRDLFATTLIIELCGAALCFIVFIRDYSPLRALGLSVFHAIAAFNNAGFDVFGTGQSMIPYADDLLLNLVTAALIIFGGIGFLVLKELWTTRLRWRKFSMHTKVVLSMTGVLLLLGTLLFRLTESDMSWLAAFFNSVTARTAGFSTVPLSSFSSAGLLVMMLLMFVGASPGSTGGGIKTTTLFSLLHGLRRAATNKDERAFRYSLPRDAFRRSAIIVLMMLSMLLFATTTVMILEPSLGFSDVLFEMVSAYATVGLSTGITGALSAASKAVVIVSMFVGRLGPLTVATLWYYGKGDAVRYPEGNLAIG